MTKSAPLLLRADATARMGTGHVMRCLALAQAWQDRGARAVFAAAELPPALRDRLLTEGCAVEPVGASAGTPADVAETAALARRLGAEWMVLDGYHFGGDFQQSLKDAGLRVLAVDDYGHAGRYPADLVLNQNLGATADLYADRGPKTRLLLGTRYALLRREFAAYRGRERSIPEIGRKVLVTLGGSDPDNVTLKVIQAIGRVDLDGLEAVVVVGAGNPRRAELEAAARVCQAQVEVRANVADMPGLMAWADAAVAAGGTTSWERALLGLPSLVLVLADNQLPVAEACGAAGIARNLGRHRAVTESGLAAALERLLRDREARTAVDCLGREVVDGLGSERVARALAGTPEVRLRLAVPEDALLLWEWANDPDVRRWSFTPDPISWVGHVHWFAGKLAEPDCLFLLAADGDAPIGQIRFDFGGTKAVVSVSLAPQARGRGYAAAVLRAACREALSARPVGSVVALIRPGNAASLKAFEAAGFRPDGEDVVRGLPALRYRLTR